jgi:hypothetical protein
MNGLFCLMDLRGCPCLLGFGFLDGDVSLCLCLVLLSLSFLFQFLVTRQFPHGFLSFAFEFFEDPFGALARPCLFHRTAPFLRCDRLPCFPILLPKYSDRRNVEWAVLRKDGWRG